MRMVPVSGLRCVWSYWLSLSHQTFTLYGVGERLYLIILFPLKAMKVRSQRYLKLHGKLQKGPLEQRDACRHQ